MKYFACILLIFIASVCVLANKDISDHYSDSLQKANEYYSNGNYESAIRNYKMVIDSGYVAAELYYNLGNAYYRISNLPYSIINYERGLLLDPSNQNIKHNLMLAQARVIDEIDIVPELFIKVLFKNIIALFPIKTWAILSVSLFIITMILFYVFLFTRNLILKKVSFWLAILLFVCSILTYIFSYQQKNNVFNNKSAIITNPSVTLKSSPGLISTDLFILHEGTKVKVIKKEGDWNEVKMSNGNTGWLKSSSLEVI